MPDAESVATFIAAWDARAARPRSLGDYVRLAEILIGTFIGDLAGDWPARPPCPTHWR